MRPGVNNVKRVIKNLRIRHEITRRSLAVYHFPSSLLNKLTFFRPSPCDFLNQTLYRSQFRDFWELYYKWLIYRAIRAHNTFLSKKTVIFTMKFCRCCLSESLSDAIISVRWHDQKGTLTRSESLSDSIRKVLWQHGPTKNGGPSLFFSFLSFLALWIITPPWCHFVKIHLFWFSLSRTIVGRLLGVTNSPATNQVDERQKNPSRLSVL